MPSAAAPDSYSSLGGISSTPGGWITHFTAWRGATGFSSASTAEQVAANWSGEVNGVPKVVIITGASGGIGLESAAVLAGKGAEVILAVRNPAKGEAAVSEIQRRKPGARVSVMALDVSSLKSVRAFAAAFKATGKPLHVLMLNAGVMLSPFELSADGHEMQFATNHLGHWLLTQLLLEVMLDTAEKSGVTGRIVSVSSIGHQLFSYPGDIRFDQLDSPEGYDPEKAYGQSKLCNVLLARKLNEQLQGKHILATSCHPGSIMGTDLGRHAVGLMKAFMSVLTAVGVFTKTVPQGAATQVYLAVGDKVTGGEYYLDCNLASSSAAAHSKKLADRLWEVSEQMCKE